MTQPKLILGGGLLAAIVIAMLRFASHQPQSVEPAAVPSESAGLVPQPSPAPPRRPVSAVAAPPQRAPSRTGVRAAIAVRADVAAKPRREGGGGQAQPGCGCASPLRGSPGGDARPPQSGRGHRSVRSRIVSDRPGEMHSANQPPTQTAKASPRPKPDRLKRSTSTPSEAMIRILFSLDFFAFNTATAPS